MAGRVNIAEAKRCIIHDRKIKDIHHRIEIFLRKTANSHPFTQTKAHGVQPGFGDMRGRQNVKRDQKAMRARDVLAVGKVHDESHRTRMQHTAQTKKHNGQYPSYDHVQQMP